MVLAFLLTGDQGQLVGGIFWTLVGWSALLKSAYDRVEVNGGLLIKRLGRRPVRIEFADIREIGFERLHLWGQRNFVIEHFGGTFHLRADMRGMRAAAVALRALCAGRMDEEVKDYVARLPLRIRSEPRAVKIALTAGWSIVGLAILFDLPAAWQGFAVSWAVLVGGLLPILLYPLQARFHADRSRVGLCWLAIPLVLMGYSALVAGFIIGSVMFLRAGMVLLLLTAVLGALILWWRGKRISLVVTAFTAAAVVYLFIGWLRLGWPKPAVAVPYEPLFDFTWSQDARLIGRARVDNTEELIIIEPTGEHRRHKMEGGDLNTIPVNPTGDIYLVKTYDSPRRTMVSELYLFDPESGQLSQIKELPPEMNFWVMSLSGSNPWSPSGDKLVGLRYSSDKNTKTKTMVYHLKEKKSDILSNEFICVRVLWENENTLLGIRVDPRREETFEKEQGRRKIQVGRIHLDRDSVDLLGQYECGDREHVHILDGLAYALIDEPRVKEGKGLFSVEWIPHSVLLNLMTGEEIPLGVREWVSGGGFSWSAASKRLAYIQRDEEGRNRKLVMVEADQGKRIFEKKIKNRENLWAFRFSPPGNTLLYARTRAIGYSGWGLHVGRLEMLDVDTFKVQPLRGLGVITNMIISIARGPSDLPHWSPDGEFVAYQCFALDEGKPRWLIEFINEGG